MVRVGGMTYTIDPNALIGSRISDMRIGETLIEANKIYKVAGWAPVREGVSGEPVWDVVARWLKHKKIVSAKDPNMPRIKGVDGSLGITDQCVG